MDLKEAIGYLQAVADNAQSNPKYQRALETAIQYMDSYELAVNLRQEANRVWTKSQNRIKVLESDLAAKISACEEYKAKIAELKADLRDERDRFDRLSDFEVAEAQELAELKHRIRGLEK